MARFPVSLEINVETKSWKKLPALERRLKSAASETFLHLPKRLQMPASLTLLLTGDAAIKRLNLDFRGIGKATNVLSFPQYEPSDLPKKSDLKHPLQIGDIAMGYQYMVAECKRDHKILINHTVHLLIHGILHLFGYDHGSDDDATRMEKLEIEIMAALKLPNPYTLQTSALRKK